MRFYVSKCHDTMNGREYSPETVTPYLCLNPYYNASLKPHSRVRYLLDSGAFQDVRTENRLTAEQALSRQLAFEKRVGRKAESIVSYDRLVDEQVKDGVQFKERVSSSIGKEYVNETVENAKYLCSQRKRLGDRRLVLSCQGADDRQYMDCMKAILDIAEPRDVIGLGGFCILSKSVKYETEFYNVVNKGFPLIRDRGIKRVHIFGMGVFRVLVQTDIREDAGAGMQLRHQLPGAQLRLREVLQPGGGDDGERLQQGPQDGRVRACGTGHGQRPPHHGLLGGDGADGPAEGLPPGHLQMPRRSQGEGGRYRIFHPPAHRTCPRRIT